MPELRPKQVEIEATRLIQTLVRSIEMLHRAQGDIQTAQTFLENGLVDAAQKTLSRLVGDIHITLNPEYITWGITE